MIDTNEAISGIYMIRCKINNSVYIGESVHIYKRWEQHRQGLEERNHHNYKLQVDYNKFGVDNFQYIILQTLNIENMKPYTIKAILVIIENFYIKMYSKITNVYNIENTLRRYLETDITDSSYTKQQREIYLRSKYKIMDIIKTHYVYYNGEKVILKKCYNIHEYLVENKIISANEHLPIKIQSINNFVEQKQYDELKDIIKVIHHKYTISDKLYEVHTILIIDEIKFKEWFINNGNELLIYAEIQRLEVVKKVSKPTKPQINIEKSQTAETNSINYDNYISKGYIPLSRLIKYIYEKNNFELTHYYSYKHYLGFLIENNIINRIDDNNYPTDYALKQDYIYRINTNESGECKGILFTLKAADEIEKMIINTKDYGGVFIEKQPEEEETTHEY